MGRLNRSAYISLVDGDLAWLRKQPDTLERQHIVVIVVSSVDKYYPPPSGSKVHEWFQVEESAVERCVWCIKKRQISAALAWEYFDAYTDQSLGFDNPECINVQVSTRK